MDRDDHGQWARDLYAKFVMLAVVSCASLCNAATIGFDGDAGTPRWNDPANWTTDRLPSAVDYVYLDNGAEVTVDGPGATARYVDVFGNATLNVVDGELTFGNGANRWMWVGFESPGTVNQYGGTLRGAGSNVDLVIDRFGHYNMYGGSLIIPDDMFLYNNSVVNLTGPSQITIGDDFRTERGAEMTLNITLVGDEAPRLIINDSMQLLGRVALSVDTALWTGSNTVTLFEVNNGIDGEFAAVTLNGTPVSSDQFTVGSRDIVMSVNEPSTHALTATGMFVFGILLMPRWLRLAARRTGPLPLHATLSNWPKDASRSTGKAFELAGPHQAMAHTRVWSTTRPTGR